jgi:hypothetical protein
VRHLLLILLLLLPPLLIGCPERPEPVDDDDTSDDDDSTQPVEGAPVATITSPEDGALINTPDAVNLIGAATDEQDGELSGASLRWSSDVDGNLGTGESLVVALSVGEHELRLVATDSDGNTGFDVVEVTVAGENQPPQAFIDAPDDGDVFIEGTTVTFEGHADDPEDGALAGASLFWTSSEDGSLGSGAQVDASGLSLGEHDIVLTAVDSQGEQGLASVHIEIAPVGTNLAPDVEITAPADNESFLTGETVGFVGSAEDPEDGTITGSDLVWYSSVDGGLGSGETVDTDTLTAGVHSITLTATDTEGLDGTDSITVVVNVPGNDPPTATILGPSDGSTFVAGDDVDLLGEATDPEDGALTDSSLVWTSSQDGAIGTGEALTLDTLSAGGHTIQLTATDSGGAVGTDSIALTVLPANTAPTTSITAPPDGSSYDAGDTISFAGTSSDPEDGALTGSSLVWQSSLDGPMGSGGSLSYASLSVGLHQVTLTAVDSGGLSGSDTIEVTVDPAAVNLPPVAFLTGPSAGDVGALLTFDGSSSSDSDGAIVDYSFDFGDASAPSAGSSPVATHAYASDGTFTVTLTVTDDDGATGQATLDVDLVIPIPVPEVVWDTADVFGTDCAIALDSADLPHVAFKGQTHGQLLYAVYDGATWSVELVDGPGFDVGGTVGTQLDLAVDSAGAPHLAYTIASDSSVRYATTSAAGWTREQLASAYPYNTSYGSLAIALDPSQGERPTIGWSYDSGTPEKPVIGVRTGPGAWTEEIHSGAYDEDYFVGGLAFDSSGVAWIAYNRSYLSVVNWQAGVGFSGDESVNTVSTSNYAPLALDALEQPIILTSAGTEHRVGGVWIHSGVENSGLSSYDAATNAAGDLWITHRHGSELEVIHGDPYWNYAYQGPMDSTGMGLAVTGGGNPAACFFRSGNLMVYIGE